MELTFWACITPFQTQSQQIEFSEMFFYFFSVVVTESVSPQEKKNKGGGAERGFR